MTAGAQGEVARDRADDGTVPLDRLARFLDRHGLGQGPVALRRIGDGHSNLTFLVQREGGPYVLRRPPPPPIIPGTHDVLREVRVLSRLDGVPAPRVLAHSADPAEIGAPFYVMQHVDGMVLTDRLPAIFEPPAERRRVGEQVVDALAALHAVDVQTAGLGGFGRPDGFVDRQIARNVRMWEAVRTRDLPAFDALARWLGSHRPTSRLAAIVHGDFRLGNLMFAPSAPPRVAAILDWEMAALGDPMVDVGYLSAFWVQPGDPELRMFDLATVQRLGGFGTRREMTERYAERTGRAVGAVRYFEVLALWRLAAMMEGNYRRAASGEIENQYLLSFSNGAVELVDRACGLAGVRA